MMNDKRAGKDGLGRFWGVTEVGMVGLLYKYTRISLLKWTGLCCNALLQLARRLGFLVLRARRISIRGSGERFLVHLFT